MQKFLLILFLLFISFKKSNSSSDYSVEDIITYMNQYLDTHATKSYYMTIDPDNLLDEIDHKLLAKYQNIIFDKYNLDTLIKVVKGAKKYGNGLYSFLNLFYREFSKTLNIQDLKCIISIISIGDYQIALDSTKKIKYIFNDNILSALKDRMKLTIGQNHLFLSIYELLKSIEKGQKQFNNKGVITDL